MKGSLFVVTGTSGSGKDELIRILRKGGVKFRMVTTAVTREARAGERPGVTHHFLGSDEFEEWRRAGKFLEWAEVYGRRYGTPRREVEEPLAKGEDVLLRVDVRGARSVKSAIDDAVLIFIAPPSEDEVRRRLESRATEAGSEIAARMGAFESEMAFQADCDHVVVNQTDGQERAAAEIRGIIEATQRVRSGLNPNISSKPSDRIQSQ